MFNLVPLPTFQAPVALSQPGLAEPLEVRFTFRHKTRTAIGKWAEAWMRNPSAELLHEAIVDWEIKKDGEPVPYSLTALSELVESYTPARGEIADAYILEITRAKRKN